MWVVIKFKKNSGLLQAEVKKIMGKNIDLLI